MLKSHQTEARRSKPCLQKRYRFASCRHGGRGQSTEQSDLSLIPALLGRSPWAAPYGQISPGAARTKLCKSMVRLKRIQLHYFNNCFYSFSCARSAVKSMFIKVHKETKKRYCTKHLKNRVNIEKSTF